MNDRTCPFCGGVQSESRCEICNRPTIKISQPAASKQERRYPHPYKEVSGETKDQSSMEKKRTYSKRQRESQLIQKLNTQQRQRRVQENNAMRFANIISFIVFFFIFFMILFIAF